MKNKQTQVVGNLTIRGDFNKATVERRVPFALLEEFDNERAEEATLQSQPNAFLRALEWAKQENQV